MGETSDFFGIVLLRQVATKDSPKKGILEIKCTFRGRPRASRKQRKQPVMRKLIATVMELIKDELKSNQNGSLLAMDLTVFPPSPFSLTKLYKPTRNHSLQPHAMPVPKLANRMILSMACTH